MNNPESTDATTRSEKIGVIRKIVTDRDVEKWEVAQLKGDIAPCSRPSDLFEELEERRKARHEEVLRQLTADLQAINLKMENNVKLSSEELKAHMKYFNDKLQGIIQIIDVIEMTSLECPEFEEAQKKVKKYQNKQQTMVNELYDDLIKFENERASENEKLLRKSFEKMRKISYLLPYEIQAFLEQEVLVLNQLTLKNRRNYEELKLTLTLITEQTFKSYMDKVDCVRERWHQRKFHKTLLQRDFSFDKKKPPRRLSEVHSIMDLKSEEIMNNVAYDGNYHSRKAEEWLKKVQDMVLVIDFHGKELIEVHKKIVTGIYQNFDEKAQYIKKELSELVMLNVEDLFIQPVMYYPERELEELELYWNENLAEIKMQLLHVNEFLTDVGKLWERHAERICETEKLILKALNKADESNQAVLQDLEVKLNIALDSLRQEHTKKQLETRHEDVIAILNSIKSEYESMYLKDVSIVEDFYKMIHLEGDVLSAEFKEFIHETQPLDPTRILHCYIETHRPTVQAKHITKAITSCAQRIRAVKQWQFGIWSAINTLSDQTREVVRPRAEKWVKRKIENLADKKTVQLELLSKRFERIKIEIFEKRLREVETHEEIFDNHRKEIDTAVAQMKKTLDDLVKSETEKLYQIKEELEKSQEKAKEENRPGIIYGMLKSAERSRKEFEEKLQTKFENFRAHVQTRIFDLQQSNIMLLESIKLFHEGGDFSSQESKIYTTTLEAIDKELETELNNLEKESLKRENEISKNIAPVFTPPITTLTELYEETAFKLQMQEKLQFFEKELQESAEILKSDVDLLNKEAFFLYNFIADRRKPLNDAVCQMWNSVFRLLYTNLSNLFYPMEYQETPNESIKAEGEESIEGEFIPCGVCCCDMKFTAKPVTFKTPIFRGRKGSGKFTCKDFKSELFGSSTPPQNDGTFMGSVQHRLWTALDAFQKAACDFYKNGENRQIIRTDLLPPNYDTLIRDIVNRFKSYNTQCERFWLEVIKGFLPILAHLKRIANTYIGRKLNEYDYGVREALKTFEEDFEACLGYLRQRSQKELLGLDEKLLTLYGYPNNQDLLSSLEEEVVRSTAALGIAWESAVKKSKNSIKCFRIQHVTEKDEIRKIESEYNKFKTKLFVNDLGDSLLSTILGYCDAEGFRPKDALIITTKNKNKTPEMEEYFEEYDLKLNEKRDRKTKKWILNYLRDLVEKERLVTDNSNAFPPCPEGTVDSYLAEEDSSPKGHATTLNILLELLDFNGYAEEILKRLGLSLRKLKEQAATWENVHDEDLFKWLSNWKFNVTKVMEVYTIKKDEKPEKDPVQ